jgi:hypothetical protein
MIGDYNDMPKGQIPFRLHLSWQMPIPPEPRNANQKSINDGCETWLFGDGNQSRRICR